MMIFSCFDSMTGMYDYYESKGTNFAMNADLPVPSFPSAGNKIGVPAIIAGRPMPRDAVKIGSGWHARGMVGQCNMKGVSKGAAGLGSFTDKPVWYGVAVATAVAAGFYGLTLLMRRR